MKYQVYGFTGILKAQMAFSDSSLQQWQIAHADMDTCKHMYMFINQCW